MLATLIFWKHDRKDIYLSLDLSFKFLAFYRHLKGSFDVDYYFIETSEHKPRTVYRESSCLRSLLVLLSTQLRLSHLYGMPKKDILSFVKGLDWPQLYYYAYVCWKIPGKVRKNHMGFWLKSNETSLECESKENLSSERNFTTINISILLWTFSFFCMACNLYIQWYTS